MMKNKLWLVAITGGLLAALAWYEKATGLIMLTAFVPMLYVFQQSMNEKASAGIVFLRLLPAFLVFNLITISWLRNATIAGTIYVLLANSFLMSSVFWLSALIYKRSSSFMGYTSLITFWIILEHLNTRISILTPWLNLGNTLGNEVAFIQWYDITGVAGGTLWILLCNIAILFLIIKIRYNRKNIISEIIIVLLLLLIPSGISIFKYLKNPAQANQSEFIIIQPNIDPYSEKFSAIPFNVQLKKMLKMAEMNISASTDWVILPETAIDDPFYENNVLSNRYYLMIDSLLTGYQSVNMITGATTMKSFHETDPDLPDDSFRIDSSRVYFQIYNSALHIKPQNEVRFYHKSRLVPGVESKIRALPAFITDNIIPELGGTMTGYGTQDERTVFIHSDSISRVAPVICYESVYGEFVTSYSRNGANVIVIITNDGWWDNTAGYKQHLMFARIRAIENRKYVVRAANTGISCFIDSGGRLLKESEWWTEDTLIQTVELNNKLTFYARNGDYISRYISVFGVFIIIITFIAGPLRRLRDPQNFS